MVANRPTIKDVAKQAGVGVVTVSRALNDKEGVSDQTRERIKAVADEMGYQANRYARFLKLANNKNIALMIKGIDNPFFQQMLDTMETATRSRDYLLSIVKVPHWSDEIEEAAKLVNEDVVSGIIFLGGNFTHETNLFKKLNVPFVLSTMSRVEDVPEDVYSSVAVDDFAEAKKAVGRLIELGHRKIALVGGDSLDTSVARLRTEGYNAALAEAGIKHDPKLVPHSDIGRKSPYSYQYGFDVTNKLLDEHGDVTAIFAIADVIAIGALKAAQGRGMSVPEELSIVGFDGIPVTDFITPSLSTIVQPAKQIAQLSCELLFDSMEGKPTRHELVSAQFKEGGSIAPPRGQR